MAQVSFDAGKIASVGSVVRAELLDLARKAASDMQASLVAVYPSVTGNLQRGVRARGHKDGIGSIVQTTAQHAHLYELGTRDRTDATHENAARGRMPAANVFVPLAVSTRAGFARSAQAALDRDHEIV